MKTPILIRSILKVYIIFSIITVGFIGFLIYEGVMDNGSVEASIIYVDVGGGAQYTSIQKAVDNANPGDTIIVANGTYNESVTINKDNINLTGNSTTDCKIRHYYYGSSSTNYAAGINVTANGVNISGFNISVSGRYIYGIRINTPAKNSYISNNNISTDGYWCYGVYMEQTTDNSFVNNTITTHEYSSNGIYLYSSQNNNLVQNIITTLDDNGYGTYLYQSSDNNLTSNSIYTYGQYSNALIINWYSINNNISYNTLIAHGYGSYGIYVVQTSSDNQIINNTINITNQNGQGINLYSSNNNKLLNNSINISAANGYGISISYSSICRLSNNNIHFYLENGTGIYFLYSTQVKLSMNNLTNCRISIYGYSLDQWNTHTIDTSNTINTKPIYYYRNASGMLFPIDAGEVIIANCSNINITGVSISYGGVLIAYSSNSVIRENSIDYYGIYIYSSNSLSLIKNNINAFAPNMYGIYLSGNLNNLTGNTINSYGFAEGGIYFGNPSEYNNIRDNNINNWAFNCHCIILSGATNNNFTINKINNYASSGVGIISYFSSGNNFIGNSITAQSINSYGILLRDSSEENEIKENIINTLGSNGYGIYLYGGPRDNNITGNYIVTNAFRGYGICLESDIYNNNILKNQISTIGENAYGIALYTSSNYNTIIDNSITTFEQRAYGIYSYRSYLNEYTGNNIETFGYRGDGVYFQRSYDNILTGNKINTSGDSYGLFLYQDSVRNDLKNNTINTIAENGIGIYLLESSNDNKFIGNNINTVGINGSGFAIFESNNTLIINCSVTTQGSNAPGIYLDGYFAIIQDSVVSTDLSGNNYDFNITNHGNITAINCTFDTVQVTKDSGGILRVSNYLGIQIYDTDGATPLAGIDLEVVDNGNKIYSTPGYGGMMPSTDSNGRIDNIIVPDRWFDHDNNAIENITDIKVKKLVGLDWEEARLDVNMGTSHTEIFIAYENTPPATPTGLRVSRGPGDNTLNITWDHNFNTFNYTIYTKKTGDWYELTNITHPQNWCLDSDLTDEIEHYYKIQAWSRIGLSSALSLPVSYYLKDITPPTVPIGLKVQPVPLDDALNISWNTSFDDTERYEIWWKDSLITSTWEQAGNISHPMNHFIFYNLALVNGSSYIFKIRAWDKVGYPSVFSSKVSVVHRDYLAPQAPISLRGEAVTESSIKLSWEPSPDVDVEEYHVYMNESASGSGGPYELIVKVKEQVLNLEVAGLEENTTYYFVVRALDEANNPSPYSVETIVTTKPIPMPPKILVTSPANNSVNVSVDTQIMITFDLPMETSSVMNSLLISPGVGYRLDWSSDDRILNIILLENLSVDTKYTIRIEFGVSTSGGLLKDTPFVLNFRTERKAGEFSISILSPSTDSKVKPGYLINVSGVTSGLSPDTQIKITLHNITKTTRIGADGKWIIDIQAPAIEGNYLLTVSFNGINDSVSILVREPDKAGDDTDDDFLSNLFGGNPVIFFVLILIIVIIIIIVTLLLVSRKTYEKRGYDKEMDRFIDEEELAEEGYEDEDLYKGEGEDRDWGEDEDWEDEEWEDKEWEDDGRFRAEEELSERETPVDKEEDWEDIEELDELEDFEEMESEDSAALGGPIAEEEPRPRKAKHTKKSKASKKKSKGKKSEKPKKSKHKTKAKAEPELEPEPESEEQEELEELGDSEEFEDVEDWDEDGLEWDEE